MASQNEDPAGASIGDLFGQLVEDGRHYVRSEAHFYKQVAAYRVNRAKAGLVAAAVGGVLLLAGLIAAMVGLVLGLAPMIGPVGGGLVVLAANWLIGFALVRFGAVKLRALSGDAEERAVIEAAERGE